MDRKRETEEDIEANRVIEYYKKYCRNPDLVKYFSGPEASFVGKIGSDVDNRKIIPSENQQPDIVSANEDHHPNLTRVSEEPCISSRSMKSPTPIDEETEEKNHSRSSSVASSKIEWDNGADIGYKNSYQFLSARKSASFPSLLTQNVSVNSKVHPKETAEKSISENIQELRKMYLQLTFSSETSSSPNKGDSASSLSKEQEQNVPSSSREDKNTKTRTKSSSSSDSYLRRKIGYPVAYSTPHEETTSKESTQKSLKTETSESSKKQSSHNSKESTDKSSKTEISTKSWKNDSSNMSREFKSESLNKPGVYSVTPMLTLSSKPKRNLNNDGLFIVSEKHGVVDSHSISSPKQINPSNSKVSEFPKNSSQYRKKINLCLTKPISVECLSLEIKNSAHKDVQTSFSSDKSSKFVQTDEILIEEVRFTPQTQNVEYIKFGEKTLNASLKNQMGNNPTTTNTYISLEEKNCKATQTENLSGKFRKTARNAKEAIDKKQTDFTQQMSVSERMTPNYSSDLSSMNTISDENESKSDILQYKKDYDKNNENEFHGEEMLLAEMISLNYSKNLNTDIKRSINILQKLLKSRKYDKSTKKYYIKKIVQKIVDSKYSDDSTSSDLFIPAKKNVEPKSERETKSESQKPKSATKLMDNLPWYPISEPLYSMPKNNTKKSSSNSEKKVRDDNNLNVVENEKRKNQTFILPLQKDRIKIPEAQVDTRNVPLISPEDLHRLYTNTEDTNINQRYASAEKTQKVPKFASKSSTKLAHDSIPQKDYRPISSEGKIGETNWRTAKTLSEKLLENRDLIDFKNGQGDYLLHVVKNERHHQLSWINNEIEHLVKLKEMLEKKPEKTRPDSKLKDVISSLLKMKENDMKGLPKNFEVFICKSEAPKGKCDPHCQKARETRKTACLTPGYYTIETQLDPDGNLLDLTVFDGSGSRKYNYKSDGVVDDVSISSKNHNTEVKLKPKAGENQGRLVSGTSKECCACGRMFAPPSNDSEMSVCEECAEESSSLNPPIGYKICKDCGRMFMPPKENPNICICQECYYDKPVSDRRSKSSSNAEICEACGRIFVRKEDDFGICLCKRCRKELEQEERRNSKRPCNICRVCGRRFFAYVQDLEHCVCKECSELDKREEKKCSCQKVSFGNPLERGGCRCVTKDSPVEKRNKGNDCCSSCGRDSSQCVCGPKFVPKKPKLIGGKMGENSYAKKGSPCSHCVGLQANVPGKSNLVKCSSPCDSAENWESKYCAPECPKSKLSITFDDECSEYCPGELRKISQLSMLCPGSTQSSAESLQSMPNKAQNRSPSQQSAKKETCCKACSPCSTRKKNLNSPRNANQSKLGKGGQRTYSLQSKKSCQCCTCTNCSVQTKRPGDKNARCQCCICENCGTQASLDEIGKSRKIVRSKWCTLKHSDTKTNKKSASGKSNRTYVECEKKKRRKKDELDCTDESLQSISSGNIICITPTKYKNMNKQKSDSMCQCATPRRRCELEQHKSLQICPSVLKAICKSVNTPSQQERICAPNCPQASPGTSDSYMHIRIPQGVQCSDIEIDYEVKPSSKSFFPQICFFSPTSAPPSPCPPPCRPPPCPPPCRPSYPPAPSPSTYRPPSQPCPPPCPPPTYRPCPTFYPPPPCRPPPTPCVPPSCRPCPPPCAPPPCRPCPPPCPPPPCRPCPPPCPPPTCRPCPPPCSPPPCRPCPPPCSPPPCNPCPPPPCRPCPSSYSPPPCRPCPPPSPPPCRPCPSFSPPPPPCNPCPPPPCNPCPPPICRPCPSQCRPCPPPCRPPPPPCQPPPCRPCPPPTRSCSPCPSCCPPPCRSCGPCPPPPCKRKSCKPPSCKVFPPCTRNRPPRRNCKPFPLLPRSKSSCRTVCCAPAPCCPPECTPPPSRRPSGCCMSDCPFQDEKPPSAPPGCRCKTPPPEPSPAKQSLSVSLHLPCKLCGIPPCAAISSMSCPTCSKCKHKSPANDSDSLKPKTSRSDSDNRSKAQKNDQKRPKAKSRETSKPICEPCDEDDNSSNAPDDDGASADSSPSSSSIPSRSVPPDESRSCESLDYPCKPLKAKTAKARENASEESLTCPSKKAVCPAKPPPCPGAGDKPCPSFPPAPCPNRKGRDRDEDHKSRPSKSGGRESQDSSSRRRSREERKSIQDNESILMPVSIKSRSPLQEPQNGREYKPSEGSSRDLQTQDEMPSMPSTSPPKSARSFPPGNNNPNVQVYRCTAENQAYPNRDREIPEKQCTCSPGTCKCCQTATHEEKDIQCPAFRQCTCQTEPKEDANVQCNCKEHAGVSCNCDEISEDKDDSCKCKKSSSSSSSSSNSGSDSHMSCICCKKEKILKNLISKIPLCEPCQQVSRTNFYPHNYCDPNHSCICYSLVNRDVLCQFRQTLTELERLDIYQQYCEVLKNCKCCKKCGCKCKLPTKFKNGCAYFLKLEDACPNRRCEEEGCDSDLFDCEEEEGEDRENHLPEVTVKVPNCRCSGARKKKNGDAHEARKFTSCPSIQNYLCTLKPEFIARAERRRRILRDATTQREENSEKRKLNFIEKVNYLNHRKANDKVSSESNIYKQNGYQTKAYCVFDIELNDSPKRVQPRVFKSFREMKDLTRRRYLHLTEVKSKKKLNKEKRLREANRLLANTFTRRLQRSTLRGNVDIPLNVKVVAF